MALQYESQGKVHRLAEVFEEERPDRSYTPLPDFTAPASAGAHPRAAVAAGSRLVSAAAAGVAVLGLFAAAYVSDPAPRAASPVGPVFAVRTTDEIQAASRARQSASSAEPAQDRMMLVAGLPENLRPTVAPVADAAPAPAPARAIAAGASTVQTAPTAAVGLPLTPFPGIGVGSGTGTGSQAAKATPRFQGFHFSAAEKALNW